MDQKTKNEVVSDQKSKINEENKNTDVIIGKVNEVEKETINKNTDVIIIIDETNENNDIEKKAINKICEISNDAKVFKNVNENNEVEKKKIKKSTNIIIDGINNDVKVVEKVNEIENNSSEIADNPEDSTNASEENANVKERKIYDLEKVEEVLDVESKQQIIQSNEIFCNQQNVFDGSNSIQNRSLSLDEEHDEDNSLSTKSYDYDLVHRFLSEKNPKELIQYLNDKCDYDTTSSVFDKCQIESPDIYTDLCKEGVSLGNAVGHHKYALILLLNNSDENSMKLARSHLEIAIEKGYNFSCFSLARLLHEHFKENESAFDVATEGARRGDKLSQCIVGHFTSNGIGTKKNRRKGVKIILESGAENYFTLFATDIGLYFLDLANDEEQRNERDSNCEKAFEWFEKAYLLKKTSATINNYALCFLKGIFVQKNIEKVKEIFVDGAERGDANSMYHLAYILEESDINLALEYYKRAADIGHMKSKFRYSSLIIKKI